MRGSRTASTVSITVSGADAVTMDLRVDVNGVILSDSRTCFFTLWARSTMVLVSFSSGASAPA